MRARAAVAVVSSDGHDRLVTLRSDPPLTLRPTPAGVHLVGTSAGPLGGDDLALDLSVGPGASLTMRSSAATVVQPGARPGCSRLRVDATVAAGGRLTWRPEPTVVVRGCDHEATVTLRIGPGASLVWREEVVLGRHDEPPGSVWNRLRVDRHDGPLLRNDQAFGPRWPGSLGPAGAGTGTRCVATALVVAPDAPGRLVAARAAAGVRAASSVLADDAALVTVVGPGAAGVAAALDAVLAAFG